MTISFLKNLTGSLTLMSPTSLKWLGKTYPCLTGEGGIRVNKKEGDMATPAGTFPLRRIFYREDRVRPFPSALPMTVLAPDDGWCDDPHDPLYNQHVKLPYPGRHETLWREDSQYNIIVVLGYNDFPVLKGKGSAIFMHIMNENKTPTAGCIALHRNDMIDILRDIDPKSHLEIPHSLDTCLPSSPPSSPLHG